MQKVTAANGDEYNISWIGVANLDGALRFGIVGGELANIMGTFTNPNNCAVITRTFDENYFSYEGYTVFRGVRINYNGEIIVTMSKI